MPESLQTALIALTGVGLGGLLTGWFQRANTKALMDAEFRKLALQIRGEAHQRLVARKKEWLMESVPQLVATSDPELHAKFDYPAVVILIHRIQLILDPNIAEDAQLNHATSTLGFAVRAAASGQRDVSALLAAQDGVIGAARAYLHKAS